MLLRNAWEKLRWRNMDWERIPPDSRELVVPYLSVQDNLLGLNQALTTKKDKLRKELKKSYKKAVIPAFDAYPSRTRTTSRGCAGSSRWASICGASR
jgi:hypothetical protein